MEVAVIAAIVGFSVYMFAREKKFVDYQPRMNRKEKLPNDMNGSEYIERVVAENNAKERVGKMRAENQERIKKDFL